MAMARPMGRPSSPPFALIGVVVLLVIAVGAAVALYMQQTKLEKDAADAADRATKAQAEVRLAKAANQTILDKFMIEASLAGGVDLTNAQRIRDRIDAVLNQITRDPDPSKTDTYKGYQAPDVLKQLMNSRDKYYQDLQRVETQKKDIETQIKTLTGQVTSLEGNLRTVKDEEAKARADLLAKHTGELAKRDSEIKSLNDRIGGLDTQLSEAKMKLVAERTQADAAMTQQQNRIVILERKVAELNSAADQANIARMGPAKAVDGSVAQVFSEMNMVYLKLARPELAKLGMRFVAFAKDKPIPDNGQGKAVLEVASLEGGSVQAKVVKNTAGDPVVPGDPILNVVVGARKLKFVVYGNFDLNGDGVTEPNGKFQLESLIKRWGGETQDQLDISTNIVVLGEQPTVPTKPDPNAGAAEVANYEQKAAENRKWTEIYDRAYKQTIPIMNTVTILYYIGFFNDDRAPGWEKRVRPGEDYFPAS